MRAQQNVDSGHKTYYVIQSFSSSKQGYVIDPAREVPSEAAARREAERLSRTKQGVVAFSRSYDADTGEYNDAVVIAQYGHIPEPDDGGYAH